MMDLNVHFGGLFAVTEPETEDGVWLFDTPPAALGWHVFTQKSGHVESLVRRKTLEVEKLQFSEEKTETQVRAASVLKSLLLGRDQGRDGFISL